MKTITLTQEQFDMLRFCLAQANEMNWSCPDPYIDQFGDDWKETWDALTNAIKNAEEASDSYD